MNVPFPALLFAAGLGTRMRPLTDDRPKPLVPVAGRCLLDHALDQLVAGGVQRVVINTHYLPSQIEEHVQNISDLEILLSPEQPTILETGGGLRKAMPLLGAAPYVTLNSDAVWLGPNAIDILRQAWDAARMDALLLLVPKIQAHGHKGAGDFFMTQEGKLTPRAAAASAPFIYSGVQIIAPPTGAVIAAEAFSMWEYWNMSFARGRVYGVAYDGGWVDVGHPDAIALAESLMATA